MSFGVSRVDRQNPAFFIHSVCRFPGYPHFAGYFPTQGTAAAGITLGALGAAVLRANRAKTVIPTKAFENELGPIGMSDGWLIIVRNRKKSSYMVY